MSNNDLYFETLKETQGEMTDDLLSGRIAEINVILGQLTSSPAWNILLHDSKQMIKRLDDTWQNFPDGATQLKEARVLKMAYQHIFDLPMKYAEELDMLLGELKKRQNTDEIVQKDVDNG